MLARELWPERITIKIASELFGLHQSTLFKRMQQGKLPPVRKDHWMSASHWLASDLTEEMLQKAPIKYPCPKCGKCGKAKYNRQAPKKYIRCKSCNHSWAVDLETGKVSESRPVVAKPKPEQKQKAEKMAKTIRQTYTEDLREMRDKKARQLVGNIVQPVNKAAIEQKKRFRDIEDRINSQKTERDLYGWD